MAEKNELIFKDESELLANPVVISAIDKARTEAEQDNDDKIDRLKDMVIKQAIAIGLETDSFITSSLKDAIGTGDEDKISESYDSIKQKLEERSLDSLCDTLSDIDDVYMRNVKGSDTIQKKVSDAIKRDPEGDGKDSDDPKNKKKDPKGTDTDKDKKNKKEKVDGKDTDNPKDQPAKEPKDDVNNPEGGDSADPDDSGEDKDDPFGRVTK